MIGKIAILFLLFTINCHGLDYMIPLGLYGKEEYYLLVGFKDGKLSKISKVPDSVPAQELVVRKSGGQYICETKSVMASGVHCHNFSYVDSSGVLSQKTIKYRICSSDDGAPIIENVETNISSSGIVLPVDFNITL